MPSLYCVSKQQQQQLSSVYTNVVSSLFLYITPNVCSLSLFLPLSAFFIEKKPILTDFLRMYVSLFRFLLLLLLPITICMYKINHREKNEKKLRIAIILLFLLLLFTERAFNCLFLCLKSNRSYHSKDN